MTPLTMLRCIETSRATRRVCTLRVAGVVLALFVLSALSAPRLGAQSSPLPGMEWSQFHPGDHVELDVMCTGTWRPVTVLHVEADPSNDARYQRFTIQREDGSEWQFTAPGRVAPCGRAAGGIARERAGLPAPKLGVYTCNYRGQVVSVFDFALLNASAYRDYDGARGAYRYDVATRQLLFLSGPKRGTRAQQVSAVTFQILDAGGLPTGNYCPHNPARNANGLRL